MGAQLLFFLPQVPTIPAIAFLASCYGISPGGISLAQTVLLLSILVSSAGLKPTKQFLSLVFPSCLAWKNSELVRGKANQAGFREQRWTPKGVDKWVKSENQLVNDSKLHRIFPRS